MPRFEMRVTDEWLAMVDGRRGGETRGAFVKGLVEGALGGSTVEAVAGSQEARQAVRAVAPVSRPAGPVSSAADAPEIQARDAERDAKRLPPAPRFNVTPSKWSS